MATNKERNVFRPQIQILRLMGISLEEKDSAFYKVYSIFALTGVILLPVFALHATFVNRHNLNALMENLSFDSIFGLTVVKILLLFATRRKIIQTVQKLTNRDFAPNADRGRYNEDELIEENMFYINSESKLSLIMGFVYVFSASVEIIIQRQFLKNSDYWQVPFGAFAAFNVTYNPNFKIVWAYQGIYVTLDTLACNINVFLQAVMAYLSSQFKILQNIIKASVARSHRRMMQSFEKADEFPINPSRIEWKYLRQTLKEIVDYHMDLIEITLELEDLFCYQVFVDFFRLALVICFSLFSGTSTESFNFRMLQKITLACGAVLVQLTTAYWGNEVIVQNSAIAEACAEVDYTGTDVRFQRGLALIIQRSETPLQFTVGKFSPLTLGTFLTVMKASYSYFMFLHNFN